MRFVPFMVDTTKCPPSTHPHLNTNNTVKQKDVFMDYIIISIGLKICWVTMTWMTAWVFFHSLQNNFARWSDSLRSYHEAVNVSIFLSYEFRFWRGSKGGTVVRALASHQCGLGSNPGVAAPRGLSLLLVLSLAPKGFFSGYSGFPLSLKTNTSKFQFDLEHTYTFQGVLKNSYVLCGKTNNYYNL